MPSIVVGVGVGVGAAIGVVVGAIALAGAPHHQEPPRVSRAAGVPTDRERLCAYAAAFPRPSWQASSPPSDGGYRLLKDDVAVQAFRDRIVHPRPPFSASSGQYLSAFDSALRDLEPRLKQCVATSDPRLRRLSYTFRVRLRGARGVGTIVDAVTAERLGGMDNLAVIDAETRAEACVSSILTALELPPSESASSTFISVQYDDGCSATK